MRPLFRSTCNIRRILAACVFIVSCAALADSPRERLLMDFNWYFHLGDAPDAGGKFDYPEVNDLAKTRINEIGLGAQLIANLPDPVATNLGGNVSFAKPDFDDRQWRPLDLPHDWAVELPFNTNADFHHGFKPVGPGFPENNIGWYRRAFTLSASDKGKRLWIEFDGVYRDSLVWLNGHLLGRHPSGYGSFRYDISDVANCGGDNVLAVRVDASRFEGWFYEGAGIYRHVWLEKASPLCIAPDELFVWTKFPNDVPTESAEIHVQTRLLNYLTNSVRVTVQCEVLDPEGRSVSLFTEGTNMEDFSRREVKLTGAVPGPELWSPESPSLYRLVTTIETGGNVTDRVETPFGIRTLGFNATNGFLLNGKPYFIKGTCNHQDHAGVGTAMPDALEYFRVKKLKEMGSNALRTSHNPPTPELLDACDQLGMLVMDENRRVDETPMVLDDLKGMVLRDRNHPSVFIWSLGNEEGQLQGTNAAASAAAERLLKPMQDLVAQLDPTRLCTMAMNGGWGGGLTEVIDVQGFNYRTKNIDAFRTNFPTKLAIGTETASTRTTRGVYADDKDQGYVAAYGENGVEKAWTWLSYYATHPFTSGGFVWTGFDYRGEPTPYKWPCISSHFGLMDTCGFPKDIYYYYKAWWTDKPLVHLVTSWGAPGSEGKTNLVRCFSNCDSVELFLNGKSLGRKVMLRYGYVDWNILYAPGVLVVRAYNGLWVAAEAKAEVSGLPAAIQLHPDRASITADGQDVSVVDVSITDLHGAVASLAGNLVRFNLDGPGKIIGVGNGDPSSHEADKASERRTFKGYAQVLVQASREEGTIELTATSQNLGSAKVKIRTTEPKTPEALLP